MPIVETMHSFGSIPASEVWDILRQFERYPEFAEHIIKVDIISENSDYKESKWIVLFNGNQLQWSERDYIDDRSKVIRFEQIEGDLAIWRGSLSVADGSECIATYCVEFDLGVPALESLLNPLGTRAIKLNCEKILEAAERTLGVSSK